MSKTEIERNIPDGEENLEIPYSAARDIAAELYPEINYCMEYTDAYIFSDKDYIGFGGKSPIVILKKTGEVLSMVEYTNASGNLIREWDINEL